MKNNKIKKLFIGYSQAAILDDGNNLYVCGENIFK